MPENFELEEEFQQIVKHFKKENRRSTTGKVLSYSIFMLICGAIFSCSAMVLLAFVGILFCTLAMIAPIEIWPDNQNLED